MGSEVGDCEPSLSRPHDLAAPDAPASAGVAEETVFRYSGSLEVSREVAVVEVKSPNNRAAPDAMDFAGVVGRHGLRDSSLLSVARVAVVGIEQEGSLRPSVIPPPPPPLTTQSSLSPSASPRLDLGGVRGFVGKEKGSVSRIAAMFNKLSRGGVRKGEGVGRGLEYTVNPLLATRVSHRGRGGKKQ